MLFEIDRVKGENQQLQHERDIYKQKLIEETTQEQHKNKHEPNTAIAVSKTKNYMEKVNEIIKQIS
jgi:hypothetical protein